MGSKFFLKIKRLKAVEGNDVKSLFKKRSNWEQVHIMDFETIRHRVDKELAKLDKDTFSTLDIVKVLGIPRERLRDWMVRGFVAPTQPSEKQGRAALFKTEDVYCVALFEALLAGGFDRATASLWVRQIKSEWSGQLGKKTYLSVEYEVHKYP